MVFYVHFTIFTKNVTAVKKQPDFWVVRYVEACLKAGFVIMWWMLQRLAKALTTSYDIAEVESLRGLAALFLAWFKLTNTYIYGKPVIIADRVSPTLGVVWAACYGEQNKKTIPSKIIGAQKPNGVDNSIRKWGDVWGFREVVAGVTWFLKR